MDQPPERRDRALSPRKRVTELLGGRVITTPRIEDALVVSERGGDFKLILGQDLSIGYEDREKTV